MKKESYHAAAGVINSMNVVETRMNAVKNADAQFTVSANDVSMATYKELRKLFVEALEAQHKRLNSELEKL